ncbi:MAG: hypothetical protein KF870_06735 [Leadbetterella sp.]|nr:hypothetical protein [Leadbetterella sp.]
MTFEEYLISKKIDAVRLKAAEPELFREWEAEFSQMHPESFTARKRYGINPLRRKYHLSE